MSFDSLSLVLITILFAVFGNQWSVNGECSYVLHHEDETDRQPLHFIVKKNRNISWIAPQRTAETLIIPFKMLERLIIACPIMTRDGRIVYKDMKVIHCNGYNTTTQTLRPFLSTSNGEEDPKPYSCDHRVHFIEKETEIPDETCSGHVYEIGVQISFVSQLIEHWTTPEATLLKNIVEADKVSVFTNITVLTLNSYNDGNKVSEWKSLLFICSIDHSKGMVYTKHEIDGTNLYARQKRNLPNLLSDLDNNASSDNLEKVNKIYDKKRQANIMKNNPTIIVNYFDVEVNYLTPQQLIPESDMLFISWKYATRFYNNTAPMWSSVRCVWRNIEDQIRTAAYKLDRKLIVYTGTYINYDSDHEIVYLEGIPVPHLFWKIIHDRETKKAIALITSNTPYRNVARVCSDICQANSWPIDNNVIAIGDAYCCDAVQFAEKISFIGNILGDVDGVLRTARGSFTKPLYQTCRLGTPTT